MEKRGSSAIDVSFAVASFNSGQFLEPCVKSALAQRDIACEVLIIDDGSSDGSDALAMRLAEGDERVRFFRTPRNLGPGGARNIALENMRGDWYAILDSDDLLQPARSRHLIDAAKARGADMIADDLEIFGEDVQPARFLENSALPGRQVSLDDYFANSIMYGAYPNPGFLKPMIAREFIEQTGVRYDEQLRVGEDDDLVIRLLLAGAHYVVDPSIGYRYRKHGESISHRLSPAHASAMAECASNLERELVAAGKDSPTFRKRQKALRSGIAFTHAVEAIKGGQYAKAAGLLAASPGSARLFSMPIMARLKRLLGR